MTHEELVEDFAKTVITEYLESGPEYLTIAETLMEEGYEDPDLINDVYESVNNELDTILQRWEDN